MPNWISGSRAALRLPALVLAATIASVAAAHAHHVMGGQTPATFVQGLLSGFGHPIIGIDHLAFIVAMGVAAHRSIDEGRPVLMSEVLGTS